MRILFVHNRYLQSAGGEDSTVDAEVKLLSDRGHAVETIIFNNDTLGSGLLSKVKAGLQSIYNTQSKKQLKEKISIFKPDIIHVHNFYFQASPAVFDAAHECNVPVVFTLHNYRLVCVNALLLRDNKVCEDCINNFIAWKGIIRKCYHDSALDSALVATISAFHKIKNTWNAKIDQYITVSDFMRNKILHSSLPVTDPHKIIVKRNFIEDPGAGSPNDRDNFYLFVGRLSEEKGVEFLLDTFSSLPHQYLTIVGDGPQKDELTARFGQFPNIRFVGKKDRSEVMSLLKKCRALVFPSIWYEGLPVTIIEALATATPVIGSDLGAMQEMITPGENGYLFEKENKMALQTAISTINYLVEKKDFSLHQTARETYLRYYTPSVCYEKTIEIYHEVMEKAAKKKA